ncbi:MAG: MFS transporter [Afipia sp.]|nr:MFS transporter [Afipia sp.]
MNSATSTALRAFILLWLAGNGLRLTILAIPPVLALIISDLKLSGTEVGILNAIPVCLFALVSIPSSAIIARFGAVRALTTGLVVTAIGSFLRGFSPNILFLYASTAIMAAGIAVIQPSLPPIVRQWVPNKIGFSTAVYTNGLIFGEIFPVMLATLLMALLANNWRATLFFWSIPVLIIAIIITVFAPRKASEVTKRQKNWMPNWRSSLLWKLGFMMGATNQLYFGIHAFLPGQLVKIGHPDWIGPALTALNVSQLPA